ncbi:MAG: RHS repeat-associated core domain-containing protein, partial [Nitrospirae bacterium]
YENPRTTYYVYDNENILMEYSQKGKITARYTHGLGIDEPLVVKKKDNTHYYHADGLGSITALTDKYGKVAQTYSYDSFGGFKKSGDKVKDMYAFTGRIWDNDIKLYDYRNRMYDPKIGRFTSYDPSLYLRGSPEIPYLRDAMLKSPQELNPYLYVANNPTNKIDPYGLLMATLPDGGNGNLWGGSKEQDWKCSEPAPQSLNKCENTKNCCIEHDECYEKYGCNASSWLNIFPGACQMCNLKAAMCILINWPGVANIK